MMYRLLAINIDGTLLRSNGRLLKETKEAIQFVREKDVYITLVTSRNFPSAKKVAKALKVETPIVTHGGAYISSELDEPLYEKRLSNEKTFDIVQFLEQYDCNIRLLHEKLSLGNKIRHRSNLMAKTVLRSNDPLFYPMQFVSSLSDSLVDEPLDPPKIDVYFVDSEERDRVREGLLENFPEVDVILSNDKMLEVVPKGVSKLNGLKFLCDHIGVPLNKTVAIGDSYNDINMIQAAGLGVAMGEAPFEVKKAADWITRSNNQNGVGYMIKEQFRKQVGVKFLKNITK